MRRKLADAVVVTFDVPPALREAFRFTQGQHLTLRAHFGGEEIRRSYSICSAPHEPNLRIAIKRVQDGLFSSWANQELRPGHTIECMEPSGNFSVPLDPQASHHHIAFAAGSGITPVLSILKTTLREEPPQPLHAGVRQPQAPPPCSSKRSSPTSRTVISTVFKPHLRSQP